MSKIAYTTRLEEETLKKLKILAIERGVRQNDLLEEAIQDILTKYESKNPSEKNETEAQIEKKSPQ